MSNVHQLFKSTDVTSRNHLEQVTSALTHAEITRAENILIKAAEQVMDKIFKNYENIKGYKTYSKLREITGQAFETAINNQCKKITDVAKMKPAVHEAKDKIKKMRAKARKLLADELRESRTKLRKLDWKIKNVGFVADKAIKDAVAIRRKAVAVRLLSARKSLTELKKEYVALSTEWVNRVKPIIDEASFGRRYPDVPPPSITPTGKGFGIPEVPGIYFIWNNDKVAYVGQSIRLNMRLKLGSHHVLKDHHKISFLCFDSKELTWVESYYIGVLRPQLNYGKLATHYEDDQQ